MASSRQVLTLQDTCGIILTGAFKKPYCHWFQTGPGKAPEDQKVVLCDSEVPTAFWIFKSNYNFLAVDQTIPPMKLH